jgi:hypothetical protein
MKRTLQTLMVVTLVNLLVCAIYFPVPVVGGSSAQCGVDCPGGSGRASCSASCDVPGCSCNCESNASTGVCNARCTNGFTANSECGSGGGSSGGSVGDELFSIIDLIAWPGIWGTW